MSLIFVCFAFCTYKIPQTAAFVNRQKSQIIAEKFYYHFCGKLWYDDYVRACSSCGRVSFSFFACRREKYIAFFSYLWYDGLGKNTCFFLTGEKVSVYGYF